jgi:hypothetical protein
MKQVLSIAAGVCIGIIAAQLLSPVLQYILINIYLGG